MLWERDCFKSGLKGHYHENVLAFLVKRHQNYDLVLSAMQEMLLERKGKDMTVNSFHQFFQTTRTVRLTFSS